MSLPSSLRSSSERSGVTRCPSCQPTSCPSCQLIDTSRKLSLPQLTIQSQVSTLFECDHDPNLIHMTVLAYFPTMYKLHLPQEKDLALQNYQLTCSKSLRTGEGDNLCEEQRCYTKPLRAFVPSPWSNSPNNF